MSILSPAVRTDFEMTKPPSEMTPISVVPPPISTTRLPFGSLTGSPAPIAAAIGSSINFTTRAPAISALSFTAFFSTCVRPKGTEIKIRGRMKFLRL